MEAEDDGKGQMEVKDSEEQMEAKDGGKGQMEVKDGDKGQMEANENAQTGTRIGESTAYANSIVAAAAIGAQSTPMMLRGKL